MTLGRFTKKSNGKCPLHRRGSELLSREDSGSSRSGDTSKEVCQKPQQSALVRLAGAIFRNGARLSREDSASSPAGVAFTIEGGLCVFPEQAAWEGPSAGLPRGLHEMVVLRIQAEKANDQKLMFLLSFHEKITLRAQARTSRRTAD